MNKNIKNWLIQWIIWAITMLVIWVTYASTVTWWTTLTADLFNEKTVPTWAVMSFNLSACPTGWKLSDWTNWTRNLKNQFIRWAVPWGWREVWFTENATRVHRETWWSKRWDDAIVNQLDWNVVVDYDSNVRVLSQTQAWYWWTNIWTQTVYVDWVRVRPQNVALLFCEKE